MAIHYRTNGFIFKKIDLREADRLFTIFTKDFGKLEILARAIRKIKSKLRGGMELFYLTDIEFIQGKTYKTLTDASLIEDFQNLRKDLKRLKIAHEISEILDDLIKGEEKDKKVWNLLKETFQRLNSYPISVKECWLIYYYFVWNFLSILGYQPELNFCSICQKKLTPENLYFSPKEGGAVCLNCFNKTKDGRKIEPNVIKILRLILKKKMSFLKKLKIKKTYQRAMRDVSESYFSFVKESQS